MTRSFFMIRAAAIVLGAIWLLNFLLVWGLHRPWWHLRGVRRTLWIIPSIIAVSLGLWWLAMIQYWIGAEVVARLAVSAFVVMSIGILVSLPITGVAVSTERIIGWVRNRIERRKQRDLDGNHEYNRDNGSIVAIESAATTLPESVDGSRRAFVATAAAGLPVLMAGVGIVGMFRSDGRVIMPEVPLTFDTLDPALHGFSILHLSDIHLGPYRDLDDLERVMLDAERRRPDIVLVTGDLADDLTMLPPALAMIAALKPKYGTYASIGNHEYYSGITQVMNAFDRGPIPLLRNLGTSIPVGSATLHLLGADDPAHDKSGVGTQVFLRSTVERALDGAPSDAFHLLMSHRPKGFNTAIDNKLQLTLSGHTHGGIQVGLGGRSILEPFLPEEYMWGHYRKGDSQLFTSGGVGHWFPFRLGCPPEAPIYTLKKS